MGSNFSKSLSEWDWCSYPFYGNTVVEDDQTVVLVVKDESIGKDSNKALTPTSSQRLGIVDDDERRNPEVTSSRGASPVELDRVKSTRETSTAENVQLANRGSSREIYIEPGRDDSEAYPETHVSERGTSRTASMNTLSSDLAMAGGLDGVITGTYPYGSSESARDYKSGDRNIEPRVDLNDVNDTLLDNDEEEEGEVDENVVLPPESEDPEADLTNEALPEAVYGSVSFSSRSGPLVLPPQNLASDGGVTPVPSSPHLLGDLKAEGKQGVRWRNKQEAVKAAKAALEEDDDVVIGESERAVAKFGGCPVQTPPQIPSNLTGISEVNLMITEASLNEAAALLLEPSRANTPNISQKNSQKNLPTGTPGAPPPYKGKKSGSKGSDKSDTSKGGSATTVKSETAQQAVYDVGESLRTFTRVMMGVGFRVLLHQKSLGVSSKSVRIMKFDPIKNRLYWRRAMLKAVKDGKINIKDITRVDVDESVIRLHKAGGQIYTFETSHKEDCQIFEIAIQELRRQANAPSV